LLNRASGAPIRSLKIGIATAGRFHVLDLARELDALGHEVTLYSFVPRGRARAFGLPSRCHVALLPLVFPLIAWERLLPKLGRQLRERLLHKALDWAVILRLRRCDVFIFMSGIYLDAARTARRRFGARLWLERGSQHILAQDELLAAVGGERPSAATIRRELDGYAEADRIIIASTHVQESFRRDAGAYVKLFRNPYGVDTAMFSQPKAKPLNAPPVFLYAGTWSLRKGCDLLTDAVRSISGVRLRHVGNIGDCPFPADDERFEHVDAVPQWKLNDLYWAADAFVLASREDGFGMVLSQALAAGLPVIGTDRTGAPDLALTPALAARISVVPQGSPEALASAIATLRDRLNAREPFPPLTESDRETLSWAAYGRRYAAELLRDAELERAF
jgi:glycosyltransferase involved in cell wall biosynthesis